MISSENILIRSEESLAIGQVALLVQTLCYIVNNSLVFLIKISTVESRVFLFLPPPAGQ